MVPYACIADANRQIAAIRKFDLHCLATRGIIVFVAEVTKQRTGTDVAPSSSGLGRHPLKVKIVGSNPTGVTTQTSDHMGMWCRGLTCDPVKVETAGSNPVIPATEPPMCEHRWFFYTCTLLMSGEVDAGHTG